MADLTKADLREAFKEALQDLNRGGYSGRSTGGGGESKVDPKTFTGAFTKIGEGLLRTIDNAGQLVGKAYDNTATVADASKSVTKFLGEFGTAGSLAGNALEGITNILVDAVDNWQTFSNFGLQFGGNAIGLNEAVKKTGLTFREYEGIIDKLVPAFANFGQGLNSGAETFGELSNRILNSPGIQSQMNLLGLRTKDVNEALATVIRSAGYQADFDARDKAKMDALMNSALELAKEMDKMAKLTGVSRKEQEKAIETMQNDEAVRARIVLLRKQNPAAEASIGAVQTAAGALDPQTQKLLMESIAGKGIMSTESMGKFQSVFGPEALSRVAEIGRLTTSQNAEDRERARTMTEDLFGLLAKSREQGAELVARKAISNEFTQAAFSDPRYDTYQKNLKKYIDELGEVAGTAKARQEAEALGAGKTIRPGQDANGKEIPVGADDPRRMTTELITNMNTQIKSFSTGLSEVITQINTTIASQRDANDKYILAEKARETKGYGSTLDISSAKEKVTNMRITIEGLGKSTDGKPVEFTEAFTKWLQSIGATLPPKQARGSKDVFGGWFNKDYGNGGWARLDGKEASVPEDKVMEFINDMVSQNPSVIPTLPNLSSVLKNIPSKVSSSQQLPIEETSSSASQEPVQDKMIDKLDEISTTLAANLIELRSIASHARDTASNTKDMGGYIG